MQCFEYDNLFHTDAFSVTSGCVIAPQKVISLKWLLHQRNQSVIYCLYEQKPSTHTACLTSRGQIGFCVRYDGFTKFILIHADIAASFSCPENFLLNVWLILKWDNRLCWPHLWPQQVHYSMLWSNNNPWKKTKAKLGRQLFLVLY